MTSERWQRALDLFNAAAELPPGARAAYLAETCPEDEALRQEVEELLAAYEADPEFLEDPAARAPEPPALGDDAEAAEGRRIGPYKLLRRLGEGGMGAVYLAVRDDDQYRKHVALKLIKRGMDTDRVLRRFRHERQILASLDHPNVARLLDGGATDDGRPYFAMEHVEGQPLDAYCDARRLPIAARLALFRTVCAAVHAAHQNLVVHRDLKPSNILVTADGTVKLLDFGIAKLLNPDLSPVTIPVTRTELRLMTPAYASPEQVRGEPITTASDLYQLGVLLYELLTGHRPYRLASRTAADVARVICEEEPERPSTAVRRTEEVPAESGTRAITPHDVSAARATEPERLRRRLAGDLDTIVLKAMHKEPGRRYASAEALAEDIQRYLDGLPVAARPDTAGYRLRKFVRRHRWGVAGALLLALSLLLGIGGTAWQARVATAERDRARREAARAAQVSDFLIDLFQSSDPTKANDGSMTAREMLDEGAEKLRADLADDPAVQAPLLGTVGKVYQNLGLYEPARTALDEAVAGFRRAGDTSPAFAAALLQFANLEYRRGRLDAAEPLAREALALTAQHYGADHPETASVLNTLAVVLEEQGRVDEARATFQRVVEIRRQEAEPGANLAANLNNLALLVQDDGDLDEADALFGEAVAVIDEVWGAEHPYMAFTLNSYAGLHEARGETARAEADLRQALEIGTAVFPETHPFLAVVRHNLGDLYAGQARYDVAAAEYEQALALRRQALPPDHPDLAATLTQLGAVLAAAEQPAAAEPLLREALALRRAAFTDDDARTAETAAGLGRSLLHLGRLAEAEPLLAAGFATLLDQRGAEHPATQRALADLGAVFEGLGQPERAEPFHRQLAAAQGGARP